MGLHLAKIRFPLAHMSAAWVNISQGLEGCFTRPDGADSALLMHHFPHTTTKLTQRQFPEQLDKVSHLPSFEVLKVAFCFISASVNCTSPLKNSKSHGHPL